LGPPIRRLAGWAGAGGEAELGFILLLFRGSGERVGEWTEGSGGRERRRWGSSGKEMEGKVDRAHLEVESVRSLVEDL
jgi:hypothetical protein